MSSVVDQAEQTTDRAGDDGDAARRRFERHETEALAAAGRDDHVGGAVVGRQDVVGLRLDEADPIVQTQFVDQGVRPHGLDVTFEPARPTDDHELGTRIAERGERPDRNVGALERLDAPDEQQQRTIEIEAERSASTGLVARGEERMLDARRDDLESTLRVVRSAGGTDRPPPRS